MSYRIMCNLSRSIKWCHIPKYWVKPRTKFCKEIGKYRDVRWYVKAAATAAEQVTKETYVPREKVQNVEWESNVSQIMEYFGISKSNAYSLLDSEPRLKEVDISDLVRNIEVLKHNGLDPSDVRDHLQLLYYCPLTTEHRIGILQELGLKNMTAYHYLKFVKLSKCPVSVVISYKLLPSDYDPLSVLDSLGVPTSEYGHLKLPKNVQTLTLSQVHKYLSGIFLCWYFQCEQNVIDYILHTYPPSQIKSMRLQKEFFNILKERWDFTDKEILRHGYLFCGSPLNIQLIERNVQHLCGADPKIIAHHTPRILTLPYQRLGQVNHILEELGVTKAAVIQIPHIFTLQPRTLVERIKEIDQIPEFSGISAHPRVLRLIHYNKKVKERLDLLRQIKDTRTIPSVNLLTGAQDKFDNYLALGYMRVNRKDIVTLLSKHFKVSVHTVRQNFSLPSHRHQTSLVNVKKNLTYLSEKGFTDCQILFSLEVLIYPPELVMKHLEGLEIKLETSEKLTARYPYFLQMLLYYLDKEVPY